MLHITLLKTTLDPAFLLARDSSALEATAAIVVSVLHPPAFDVTTARSLQSRTTIILLNNSAG